MELYGLWSKTLLPFSLFPSSIVISHSFSLYLPDPPLPLSYSLSRLFFTAMESKNHNNRVKTEGGFTQKTVKLVDDDDHGEEEVRLGIGFADDKKKKGKRSCSNERIGASSPSPCCQVGKCMTDLTKPYHKKNKVCEFHSKASVVDLAGRHQRFCQQCSRFHEVSEFDETKRSCRKRLAGHNERRRNKPSESHGEASSQQGKNPKLEENHCTRTGFL